MTILRNLLLSAKKSKRPGSVWFAARHFQVPGLANAFADGVNPHHRGAVVRCDNGLNKRPVILTGPVHSNVFNAYRKQ